MKHTKIIYILLLCVIIISISICLTKRDLENFEENNFIQNRKMENQIDLLTYSKFSPDCCPAVYSNSSGCLCNNFNEKVAISTRGGNRFI